MLRNLLNRVLRRGPCFEVIENQARQWFVHARGANGEITSVGQPYANKSNAKRAAKHQAEITRGGWWKVVSS